MALRFTTTLLAAALGMGMAAFADPPGHATGDALPPGLAKQGKVPPGQAKKIWKKGEYLPLEYRERYFNDWQRYDLQPAPPGYRWVLVDNDAYLMQTTTGLVADAIAGLIH